MWRWIVLRARDDVRANLTAVCRNCRICRRSYDGVFGEPRNIVVNCFPWVSSVARFEKKNEKIKCSFLSFFYLYWFSFIFPLSFSLFLSLPLPSHSVNLFISSSPVFLLCITSCPTHQSLVITYGCYVIGHIVLFDMFIDEWALVENDLNVYLYIMRMPWDSCLKLIGLKEIVQVLFFLFFFYYLWFIKWIDWDNKTLFTLPEANKQKSDTSLLNVQEGQHQDCLAYFLIKNYILYSFFMQIYLSAIHI